MRSLLVNDPALNYLGLMLRSRIASARAAAEGEDREFGASAVEWVVITMIVLVLVGFAAAIIIPKLDAKSTDIGNCIDNAGNGVACANP
jgi:phosphotransferase system  glucose/maltose/N-acetylglucosamine-specific IIC component